MTDTLESGRMFCRRSDGVVYPYSEENVAQGMRVFRATGKEGARVEPFEDQAALQAAAAEQAALEAAACAQRIADAQAAADAASPVVADVETDVAGLDIGVEPVAVRRGRPPKTPE